VPYVFDFEKINWPEDEDADPPPPRIDQFEYLPPPQFSGAKEPARYTLPERPKPPKRDKRSLRDRVLARFGLGGSRDAKASSSAWHEEIRRQKDALMALMVPELRELGVARLYCRYDGGNDEGFAWFDHAEMADGGKLDGPELGERLRAIGLRAKLEAADIERDVHIFTMDDQPAETRLHVSLDLLAGEWAAELLGRGYGTGEFTMYGAFVIDLETLLIVDDPDAIPVVENIEISRS